MHQPAAGDAIQQLRHRRLQVDHQIRRRRVKGHLRIDLPVQRQLIGVQIQFGEQAIFVRHKIGDHTGGKQIALPQAVKLSGPLK